MTRKPSGSSRLCRAMAFLLCLAFLSACPLFSLAEEGMPEENGFSISVPKDVKGYAWCEITVRAPVAGEVLLTLYDSLENPWLYRRETLSDGENILRWDGRGAGGELLMSGPYRFTAEFSAADGREYTASASFDVRGYAPALALALPSSEFLYLDQGENWFVECWVPNQCIVAMDVLDQEGNRVYTRSVSMKDPDRDVIRWNGNGSDHQKVAPGEYTVHLYPKKNPEFETSFSLTVKETTPEKPPVTVTGPVIPERGMSDEETWEIMMKPSVVINRAGSSLRLKVYESPSTASKAIGLICCATQGLEILSLEGDWAQIRAANYNNGKFLTGWFPARDLACISPAPHYAVLVDKREQTLTVWQDGHPIATVPVSTGLATAGRPERETSPGAFLTDVHISRDFAQEGARYDYPLRYQGGNIIHSTGYARIPHAAYSVKDYSKNLPLLGQKASHGCVRVSPFTTADCPVNSHWLWTHLPYHSRVIILDD